MKKIFLCLAIMFLLPLYAHSIEELQEIPLDASEEKLELNQNKDLTENKKIYFDEEDKLKIHFNDSFMKELKVGAVYNGSLGVNFLQDTSNVNVQYEIPYVDTWVEGRFANDKTSFKINVNPVRHISNHNYMQTLWQDVWVKHEFNDNQSIMVGYYRTPNGEEGSISSYVQNFANRSQIARTFANARATGIKNSGRYKYFEYDLGFFDSTRYFETCMQGFEVVAKATVKPLEFADGKYGHLRITGSINSGKREYGYTVVNAYASYQYKKFMAEFEYAHADGYNGPLVNSNKRAQGFYGTVKYELTPKLHILARCDVFTPDLSRSNNNIEEYTVGINYYPYKNHIKLSLNYVFRNDRANKYSNRIVFVTQFMI